MDRRLIGVLALLLAAVALLVVRAAENPGLPGSAAPVALPGPPPVGSCLVVDTTVTVVECAEPHDAEVTAGTTIDDQAPSRSFCDAAAADYLPPIITGDGWQVPVDVQTAVLPAPEGQRSADRGWRACTVRPESSERFTGSLRGMTLATFRDDVFGSCPAPSRSDRIPCSAAHPTELLGTTNLAYPDAQPTGAYFGIDNSAAALPDAVGADLDHRCRTLAATLTGNPDPTYGGRLTVRLEVDTVVPTDVPGTLQVCVSCAVDAPPGRWLTASVIGLGTAPLPLG